MQDVEGGDGQDPGHRTFDPIQTSDIGEAAATSRRGVIKSGSRVARRKSDGLRTSDIGRTSKTACAQKYRATAHVSLVLFPSL